MKRLIWKYVVSAAILLCGIQFLLFVFNISYSHTRGSKMQNTTEPHDQVETISTNSDTPHSQSDLQVTPANKIYLDQGSINITSERAIFGEGEFSMLDIKDATLTKQGRSTGGLAWGTLLAMLGAFIRVPELFAIGAIIFVIGVIAFFVSKPKHTLALKTTRGDAVVLQTPNQQLAEATNAALKQVLAHTESERRAAQQTLVEVTIPAQKPDEVNTIKCKRCGSTQVTANQKGFSGGKAVAGAVLLGPIGLLGGTLGSKKVKITCLNCGHQWEPGKG
jgi:tellurium resistance protein TerD